MSAEATPPPAVLVLATAAGPHEVAAAAATAAMRARGVFSSDVREESQTGHGIDFLVTSPLAHQPSLRLRVTWQDQVGSGLVVRLDVEDVLGEEPCSSARAERAHRAVDGFSEVLAQLLAR